jgi:hypothetical protein
VTQGGFASTTTGWVALTAGLACVLAVVLIALFFTLGEPFGTLNDVANGLAGTLCGLLAWLLYAQHPPKSPLAGRLALILAVVGALAVIAGSVLVISKFTGAVQAGWYTAVGNASLGLWLTAFSYSAPRTTILTARLSTLGIIVGISMAVGIIALPALIAGMDTMGSLPWYLNLAFVGVLGTYILFPVWAVWLGRNILTR